MKSMSFKNREEMVKGLKSIKKPLPAMLLLNLSKKIK